MQGLQEYIRMKLKSNQPFLTLSGPGGLILAPPVIIVCCNLRDADMNSKLLDNFSLDLIEVLVKYFFEFLPALFRKLTSNNINPRIFSIEKNKKVFFFHFFSKNTPNIISELNEDFSEDFLRYYTFLYVKK